MPFDPVDSPVCPVLGAFSGEVLLNNPVVFFFKDIRAAFEEEHAEDIFLELRGVHLAAQDIGGREEMVFKLRQGELSHAMSFSPSKISG